jgi:hypothetical protein
MGEGGIPEAIRRGTPGIVAQGMKERFQDSVKGRSPFRTHTSPSPFKEMGIEGVR